MKHLGQKKLLGLLKSWKYISELSAWHVQRNSKQKGVDWHFSTADARIKLKRLYPQVIL